MLKQYFKSNQLANLAAITTALCCCVLLRLIPHPPNFTPVIAMGLFGVTTIKNKGLSFLLPILVMVLSDWMIGFHNLVMYVYVAIIISSTVGLWLKSNITFKNIILASCLSSIIFFLITNGAVWINSSMYTKNLIGLTTCFINAIPFFHNSLLSTLLYSSAMFSYLNVFSKLNVVNSKHSK